MGVSWDYLEIKWVPILFRFNDKSNDDIVMTLSTALKMRLNILTWVIMAVLDQLDIKQNRVASNFDIGSHGQMLGISYFSFFNQKRFCCV